MNNSAIILTDLSGMLFAQETLPSSRMVKE